MTAKTFLALAFIAIVATGGPAGVPSLADRSDAYAFDAADTAETTYSLAYASRALD